MRHVLSGTTRCLSGRGDPFAQVARLQKNAVVMIVDQWRMVSPNDKWFNRTEYHLRIHVVRVKEQNDTHFLLWILSHP